MKRIAFLGVIALLASLSAPAAVVDLMAGKTIDAGDVTITNDGTNLNVTFSTVAPWKLVETHLHVATTLAGVPQAKGNAVPGQFQYSATHTPLVGTFTYTIPLSTIPASPGTSLVIAAHAVVIVPADPTETIVKSGDADLAGLLDIVTRSRNGDDADFHPVNAPAVLAWVHPSWNALLTQPGKDLLINGGAQWIWETNPTQDPDDGTALTFRRGFTLPAGYVLGGALTLTCDNGYEAFVNGSSVGTRGVFGDWRLSNLCGITSGGVSCTTPEQYIYGPGDSTGNGWNTVKTFDVGPRLVAGASNEFVLDAANARYTGGTYGNPGGCIYLLDAETAQALQTETGWGAGLPFPGKNWSTYVPYTVQ